ncbi:hypothetical protein C8J56DRAFT_903966 [Mycena floridula]|nr:hypothetical protein C8J56DRAFT_903966 [Mycena floridula]
MSEASRRILRQLHQAGGGTIAAVHQLAYVNLPDEKLLLQFLDTMFAHLAGKPPLHDGLRSLGPLPGDIPNFHLILSCLDALGRQLSQGSPRVRLLIQQYMERRWSMLIPWIQFVVEEMLEVHDTSTNVSVKVKDELYDLTSLILAGLAAKGDQPIISLAGFTSLYARLWMCGLRQGKRDARLSSVLPILWALDAHTTTDIVDTIVSIPDAAELLIAELSASESTPTVRATLSTLLILTGVEGTGEGRVKGILKELHERKLITAVCQCFRLMQRKERWTSLHVAFNSLGVLTQCFLLDGPVRVVEALQACLLDDVAAALRYLEAQLLLRETGALEEMGFDQFKRMADVIQYYTLHPVVLRECRKWLLLRGRCELRHPELRLPWNLFLDTFILRITLWSNWKRTPFRLCANGIHVAPRWCIVRAPARSSIGLLSILRIVRKVFPASLQCASLVIKVLIRVTVYSLEKSDIHRHFVSYAMIAQITEQFPDIEHIATYHHEGYPPVFKVDYTETWNGSMVEVSCCSGISFLTSENERDSDEVVKQELLDNDSGKGPIVYGLIPEG